MHETPNRRLFLTSLAALATALIGGPVKHPTPRPGIDASRVLTKDQLDGDSEALRVFNQVREIPQIVDGIHCYCGCSDVPEFYSLLSCYESDGMARYCDICKGEGELVYELHKAGKTLDQIRSAIDAKFG